GNIELESGGRSKSDRFRKWRYCSLLKSASLYWIIRDGRVRFGKPRESHSGQPLRGPGQRSADGDAIRVRAHEHSDYLLYDGHASLGNRREYRTDQRPTRGPLSADYHARNLQRKRRLFLRVWPHPR